MICDQFNPFPTLVTHPSEVTSHFGAVPVGVPPRARLALGSGKRLICNSLSEVLVLEIYCYLIPIFRCTKESSVILRCAVPVAWLVPASQGLVLCVSALGRGAARGLHVCSGGLLRDEWAGEACGSCHPTLCGSYDP